MAIGNDGENFVFPDFISESSDDSNSSYTRWELDISSSSNNSFPASIDSDSSSDTVVCYPDNIATVAAANLVNTNFNNLFPTPIFEISLLD